MSDLTAKRWNTGVFLAKAREPSRRLQSWYVEDFLELLDEENSPSAAGRKQLPCRKVEAKSTQAEIEDNRTFLG